jgi:hypothetical protein
LAVLAAFHGLAAPAEACPFCSAVSQTFSEEIAAADAAVIAKLVEAPPKSPGNVPGGPLAQTRFEIVQVLKGESLLGKTKTLQAIYFGDNQVGTLFLVMGIDPTNLSWSTPILMSERGRKYLDKALQLPKDGPDRLAFFQEYLEDADDMLGRDAYDEFAKAPYSQVKQIKDRMHRDKLLAWVLDPKVTGSRRRLYFTMLGVCGMPDDLKTLEAMMQSSDRQQKLGLDALIAAYLMLKGPDGMQTVEKLFLSNKNAEYTDTYAAIMALRFHGQEEKVIPRERLLAGLRTMLDRPQLADLVIPDLARWEDWSAMNRLVALFKNADEESSWVRVPVVKYLQACPLPEAKVQLEELAKIDPEVVKRANTFFPFGAPATGAAKVPAAEKGSGNGKTPAKAKTPDVQKSSSSAGAPIGSDMAAATEPAASQPHPTTSATTEESATSPSEAHAATRSAATKGAEPRAVAAIGSTSLAPRATGQKVARNLGALEICGGMFLAGVAVLATMAWLLLGGQRDGQKA